MAVQGLMPVIQTVLYQVLKVAILAEKFATDYSWYVDTILTLIRIAGDYVSEEVSQIILHFPRSYESHVCVEAFFVAGY